jgi:predicted dinucleotide-binding enzyme
MRMNIGILGSGNVGATLGKRWAEIGHNVKQASRDRAGIEAAANAEVVVVALPWDAAREVLESLDLKGKVVLDATNPVLPDLSGFAADANPSGGEQVANWARGASVVKVFNTTGANNMADPIYDGEATVMFYCGDDTAAKDVARRLASELGFDPIDAGPLKNARLLESWAMLWIWLAYPGKQGREFAFKLARR